MESTPSSKGESQQVFLFFGEIFHEMVLWGYDENRLQVRSYKGRVHARDLSPIVTIWQFYCLKVTKSLPASQSKAVGSVWNCEHDKLLYSSKNGSNYLVFGTIRDKVGLKVPKNHNLSFFWNCES